MVLQVTIPCIHNHRQDPDKDFPNCYPLTKDELEELLRQVVSGDIKADLAMVRLNKAIKDQTCPQQAEGPVADKMAQVSKLFWAGYKNVNDDFVDRLHRLLNS